MGDPFRDLGDQAAAMRFSSHVGVAEGELERIEMIRRRLDQLKSGDGVTQGLMDELALDWSKGWEIVWTQLAEARAVVVAKGRDPRRYDVARAAAGDIYVDVASGRAVRGHRAVNMSWRTVSTRTAHVAIAALREAMPEVVVSKQVPIDVDLEPKSTKVLFLAAGLVPLLLVAYLIYRLVK